MPKTLLKKLLIALLYALPVVFLIVCYFCITTTEEDILQGAGTTPAVWHDLIAAFNNNARLADMYAWAVINFFDYQYQFGVDTIFRLIDVVAAVGMLLLACQVVLGRRPGLALKDSLVWGGVFLIIFTTPFGYTFYRGFSMIHNYLIIVLALLGFVLPFLQKARGMEVSKLYRRWWFAVSMGLVFGLSANFPPPAFLATYLIVKIWQVYQLKRQKTTTKALKPAAWEWWMILAMLGSMAVGYLLGPGVSGYAADPVYTVSYDYVALGDIAQNFGSSIVRIMRHMVINFGRTLSPAILIGLLLYGIALVRSRLSGSKLQFLPKEAPERKHLLVIGTFCIFVVLAGSQIVMPVRLCLPAYIGLTIIVMVLARGWFAGARVSGLLTGGVLISAAMLTLIVVRGYLALDFHARAGRSLDRIKDAQTETVCIDINESIQRFTTPFNIFQQEETFVPRRTTPITIYGKDVTHCN